MCRAFAGGGPVSLPCRFCRVAAKGKLLGNVEAADADAAIEVAAKQFKTEAWRLIGAQRHEDQAPSGRVRCSTSRPSASLLKCSAIRR